MDLTEIEKKDAVLAQQIILLSNFIANIWSKIMKIHENKFKQKISKTCLFRMTSFTAKTKLAETSKCSFISNRRTGEECGKMTVAKLRIEWSRDFLQNSRNSSTGGSKFYYKKYLKEDLFIWWPMQKIQILLHIRLMNFRPKFVEISDHVSKPKFYYIEN